MREKTSQELPKANMEEKPNEEELPNEGVNEKSSQDQLLKPSQEFPEGGTRAWLVVFGCWLALFAASGIMNSVGVFTTYIGSHQLSNYDKSTVGWIFSVYVFLSFACGLYVGPIFDKYGPRYLILVGSACHVASMMLLSICTTYWHFMLAFGILNGVGSSLLFNSSIVSVGHWFLRRRALATAIATSGGVFGGIAFPLSFNPLIASIGWPWTIRCFGFISLFCCVSSLPLIAGRLEPRKDAKWTPDLGILKDPAFALTTVGAFLAFFAGFIPLAYIPAYMLKQGLGADFSFQILPVINAASGVGRVAAGWWGDHIGVFNSNLITILACSISSFAIWLPAGSTKAGIVSFVIIFGLASGNTTSITPVCIGKLCDTQFYGRYYATAYTIGSLGSLIGIPVSGAVIEATGGDYWGVIVLAGILYALSFFLVCLPLRLDTITTESI
ncbi:hypothetical protein MCOR27_000032 [Pyricularia oryzae]|nr:hypothetical protein MCOR02_007639 [Pyricularia oryzae]KAI6289536.1 hypothetical protein MCOR27_000032 [Pyricularia oryzae]KAI6362331.1 hypothetical protein MCOR31_008290 [Pyricularia oryzae]KAI6400547.1 hypothetical protein MCOR23_004749 [Pyricularia oryzae]KAI6447731.1 hypothetical protein MCOR22_003239 [Pyricularia oryzae]